MSKSNSPLALSVVTITEPGDVDTTFRRMTAFDDRKFGFSHGKTLGAMAVALRGQFDPEAVVASYGKEHPRVLSCIKALFALGKSSPLNTRKFADFPQSGLKMVERIDWGPDIAVNVKGTCWYVEDGVANIPLLQPRKDPIESEKLAVLLQLGRQAFCNGDWSDANVNLIDLSGDDPIACARFVDRDELPEVSDELVGSYVETYVAAKTRANETRQRRKVETKPIVTPMEALIDELETEDR